LHFTIEIAAAALTLLDLLSLRNGATATELFFATFGAARRRSFLFFLRRFIANAGAANKGADEETLQRLI
jgi:hypothetical protein